MFLISFLFYQPRPPLFTQQTTTIDHHYSPSKPPQTTTNHHIQPINPKTIHTKHQHLHQQYPQNPLAPPSTIPTKPTTTSINKTHYVRLSKKKKKTTVWVRKIREETKERKREESQRLNIERRKTNRKSERKRENIILFYLYILAIVSSKYPYLL